MARGKPFAVVPVDEKRLTEQLALVQRNVHDFADQLEEHRRGMVISTVLAVPATQVLSEQLTVVYTGKGGDLLVLPPANLRGAGRGQLVVVANQGSGTVTLRISGTDTLNGTAAIPVNGTAVLWSDGQTKWHQVSALSLPSVGPGAGLIGGNGLASITLDAQGRVVAVGTATYVQTSRSLISTADITLDAVASNTVDLSANRTVGLANAGAGAAAYGSHSALPVTITLDAKGRVTAVTTQTTHVSIGASSDFTARDLIGRRLQMNSGTNLVAGDIVLSAGWGATRSISNIVSGSKDTRGEFTVTSAGAGQAANPTITLTFKDGAFGGNAMAIVKRNGGTGANTEPTWVTLSTTLTMTFPATPVAGLTYTFAYHVIA